MGNRSNAPRPEITEVDFGQAPLLVIWEVTRACDLACKHCRAEAVRDRHPLELSTEEAKRMMDEVRRLGRPLFVLKGGDPLKRPDVTELVEYGAGIGLRMGMTPSGTPLMTPKTLRRLHDAGLSRLAVSLDGSTAAIHDAFRGVPGSHDWTLAMLRTAREIGLSTQVNTTVSRYNLQDFDDLCTLMTELGIAFWPVFLDDRRLPRGGTVLYTHPRSMAQTRGGRGSGTARSILLPQDPAPDMIDPRRRRTRPQVSEPFSRKRSPTVVFWKNARTPSEIPFQRPWAGHGLRSLHSGRPRMQVR